MEDSQAAYLGDFLVSVVSQRYYLANLAAYPAVSISLHAGPETGSCLHQLGQIGSREKRLAR